MNAFTTHRPWFYLALIAPWLLFPAAWPPATALAVLLLGGWFAARRWPRTPFNLALLLWALMIAVGALVSADPDLTRPKLTGLLLGLAVWRQLAGQRPAANRPVGIRLLLAAGLASAAAGLLSLWPGSPFAGAIHANELAGALLPYPLLGLSLLLDSTRPRRPFLTAGLLLSLSILLLTGSRAAAAGLLAGLAALLALTFYFRGHSAGPPRPALLLAGLILLAGGLGLSRVLPALGGPDTLAPRLEIWHWATRAMADFPLTGIGLGSFRAAAPRLYPLALPAGYDLAHAHNIFLQIALDTGLPGLVAYLALLLLSVLAGWRAARRPQQRALILGLLAGLVALHSFGLGDAVSPGAKPGIILWTMLGLLAGAWPEDTTKNG